jgi:hypothetical protein
MITIIGSPAIPMIYNSRVILSRVDGGCERPKWAGIIESAKDPITVISDTAWVETDTEYVEASPRSEIRDLLQKITGGRSRLRTVHRARAPQRQ